MGFDAGPVQAAYAAIAGEYADRFADDLAADPFDRAVVEDALSLMGARGPVVDLGCGPGTASAVVLAGDRSVLGIDITVEMLAVAARRHPGLPLLAGDVLALPLRRSSVAGVIAWFSLHNLPRQVLSRALGQVRDVLHAGGVLVVATHLGTGEEHVDEVVLTYYGEDEMSVLLGAAGFDVLATHTRPPRPHEHQVTKLVAVGRAS